MRKTWTMALGLAVVLALVVGAYAEDKEVKLTGNITCAKCELKKATKCETVLVVKEKKGDKEVEVIYYFDADSHKKHHSDVCKAGKKGDITGKVTEKDGKKTIAVTKLEFAK